MAPSSPGGPFLPGGPAAPDCPASPFSPTSPFTPCGGTGWEGHIRAGKGSLGSKMFTRSSACAFCGQLEQDLAPALLVLPLKDTLFPSAILTGGPGSPAAPGSPASPGSPWVRKATGQMLPGAGLCGQLCPAPAPRLRPTLSSALPNVGLPFLPRHPAVPRHPAFPGDPKGKRMGGTHVGGSPCHH